jgi:hypothetical protein
MDEYLPSFSEPGPKQTTLCLLLAAYSMQPALPGLRNIGEAQANEDGGLEGAHGLLRDWADFTYPGEAAPEDEEEEEDYKPGNCGGLEVANWLQRAAGCGGLKGGPPTASCLLVAGGRSSQDD